MHRYRPMCGRGGSHVAQMDLSHLLGVMQSHLLAGHPYLLLQTSQQRMWSLQAREVVTLCWASKGVTVLQQARQAGWGGGTGRLSCMTHMHKGVHWQASHSNTASMRMRRAMQWSVTV
jgi:hypothetical protein